MRKQPSHELRFAKSPTIGMSTGEMLELITNRLIAVNAALEEPDEQKRRAAIKLIQTGEMCVITKVPFIRRPRTLTELLYTDRMKQLLARVGIKAK